MTLFVLSLMNILVQSSAPFVGVELDVRDPVHHYVQVEISFPANAKTTRLVAMPNWIPGSYKIRDFARHIEQFTARDADGKGLPVTRVDKSNWSISTQKGRGFVVSYAVYADEQSVRTNYVDSELAILNPAGLVIYEKGQRNVAHHIRVSTPANWTIETALPRNQNGFYLARDYDQLVDSPFLGGKLHTFDFEVMGVPHRWVLAGDVSGNVANMVRDMHRVCLETASLFASTTFDHYVFLSYFADQPRQGLEHANSSLLALPRDVLLDSDGWLSFLALVAHEYVHAWNVKAIRDQKMLNYDYQTEVYSELLWFHEGLTSYYDNLLLVRANVSSEKDLFKSWKRLIDTYHHNPGREQQSLQDASFNAWIHQYQKNEAFVNARSSYYRGGELAGLAMDVLIRQKSQDKLSLDDLMRHLYTLSSKRRTGITQVDISNWMNEAIGPDGVAFITQHIQNAKALDLKTILENLALEWVKEEQKPLDNVHSFERPREFEIEGLMMRNEGDNAYVKQVLANSKAWEAGFNVGDTILAIEDIQVGPRDLNTVMTARGQAGPALILVARNQRVLKLNAQIQEKAANHVINRRTKASERQQKRLANLLSSRVKDTKKTTE